MKRAYQIALVVAFLALCCVPGALMLPKPENPHLWGVRPVPFPPFEASLSWAPEFEKYFVANFGLKRKLVQLHNLLGYRVLRDLQSENVLVGKNKWLYLCQDSGWQSFRSEDTLSPGSTRSWLNALLAARRFLIARETPMITLVPPSKETIYPEYLPWSATRANSFTRLDEMLALFKRTHTDYIDLRDPLRAAHDQFRVYDRFDSHWNGRGAEIGARLLMQRVAEVLGRPPSYAELDAQLVPNKSSTDLAFILALEDRVTEPSMALVPKNPRARRLLPPPSVVEPNRSQQTLMVFEVDDPSLPSAIILRDSFAEGIMPVLVEKFRRSTWLWTHDFDFSLVNRESPDVVIIEMTERFYAGPPPRFSVGHRLRPRRQK